MNIDMNYINKIQNEIFSYEQQNEKNYYVAQELLHLLLCEEKDSANQKEIINIFNQLVSYSSETSL